jgi:WD40 repeat protein
MEVAASNDDVGPRLSLRELRQPTTRLSGFSCFSPDGSLLAWVGGGTHVYDLASAEKLPAFSSRAINMYQSIAFHPDSKLLTFVSGPRVIEAWNVRTGQRASSLGLPEDLQNQKVTLDGHMALSRDGRLLAAEASGSIAVWDTQSKKLVLRLPRHRGAIWSMDWSPDGSLLAVGTSIGGPVIWNIPKIRGQLATLALDW